MWIVAAAWASPPGRELQECPALHPAPASIGPNADLREVDLSCTDLRGVDLSGARLDGADLSGARLNGADLSGARLSGADLRGALAEGASFAGASLSGARLEGAIVRFAELRGSDLREADLCGTDLTLARNLTWAETEGTWFCRTTTLPRELEGAEEAGWRYLPFRRQRQERWVSVRAFDGLGLFLYDDWGPDDPGEIDLYEDGEPLISVSLASLDLVPPLLDWSHRHWMSGIGVSATAGFGTSAGNAERPYSVVSLQVGPFVELLSFLIVEAGGVYGVTPAPGLDWDRRDDFATYAGARLVVTPGVAFAEDLLRATSGRKR